MITGGYCITKTESKKIITAVVKMSNEIKIAVEEFEKTKLPILWAEYEKMINSGVSRENAFGVIRSKI